MEKNINLLLDEIVTINSVPNIKMIKLFTNTSYDWYSVEDVKELFCKQTGFDDWRVPTIDEMKELYKNRKSIEKELNSPLTGFYWSNYSVNVYLRHLALGFFTGGIIESNNKDLNKVCLVR